MPRVQKAVRRFASGNVALGLAAAQKYFCGLAPPERVFSEELLQERRDEAKGE
ncbi:MAG TPA: hypothetical protein VG826_14915 [Pirellulales bacterium]|nr:hypothetical protein [Pirellulales bacterium]